MFRLKTRLWLLLAGSLVSVALGVWGGWYRWLRVSTNLLMKQGITALNRQDAAAAIRLFDSVLSREPHQPQALLLRGELAHKAGSADEALGYWDRVPDVPRDAGSKARYLEGAVQTERGYARRAEDLLLRAIELNPAYLPPRDLLLRIYVVQRRGSEIRRQLTSVRRLRKWSLNELLLYSMAHDQIADPAANQRLLERFVAADRDDVPSLLALAQCHTALGQENEAIELLRSRLQRHPEERRIRSLLAELFMRCSEWSSAATVLNAAISEKDADSSAYRSLGLYASEIHDWECARLALERATALDREDLASIYRLGIVLEAEGKRHEADSCLGRAKLLEQLFTQLHLLAREQQRRQADLVPIAVHIAGLFADLGQAATAQYWIEQAGEWDPGNIAVAALQIRLQDSEKGRSSWPNETSPEFSTTLGKAAKRALSQPLPPGHGHRPVATSGEQVAPNRQTAITLRDYHDAAGIQFEYFNGATGSKYLIETLGGGVAVLDFDGDNWPDLYFTQGARIPPDPLDRSHQDRLFRNLGNGRFEDVTSAAFGSHGEFRYSQGCVAGDVDNDGDPDLVVANWGENSLYLNNGDGTFVEAARQFGLEGERWNSSVALADFDRDGNLDLYVVTYMREPLLICRTSDGRIATCHPGNFSAEQDLLYRNRGDGTFEDISSSSGIGVPGGKGLGVLISDLDDDGWPDIYVANDGTGNFLFRNKSTTTPGSLRFVEEGMISGAAVSSDGFAQGSMGIAAGDFSGEGRTDLYVTNFYSEGCDLYMNQGGMSFSDAARVANLYTPTRLMVGFGTQAADFDLDGWLDIFSTNGHIDDFRYRGEPWQMPAQIFRNLGYARFSDVSDKSGEFFQLLHRGRGVARVDWDRDGKPDVVISYLDRPAALLRNETESPGNWISIQLHGVASNRDAIGARLKATFSGGIRVYEVYGGDGFFASNERRQTIGLGAESFVERLEILWPSGKTQQIAQIPCGARLVVIEGRDP